MVQIGDLAWRRMEFMGALDTLTNSDSGEAKLNFVDHGKLAFLQSDIEWQTKEKSRMNRG